MDADWEYRSLLVDQWPERDRWMVSFRLQQGGAEVQQLWIGPADDPQAPQAQVFLDAWGGDGWEVVPPVTGSIAAAGADGGPVTQHGAGLTVQTFCNEATSAFMASRHPWIATRRPSHA